MRRRAHFRGSVGDSMRGLGDLRASWKAAARPLCALDARKRYFWGLKSWHNIMEGGSEEGRSPAQGWGVKDSHPGATTRYSSARRGTPFHSGPDVGPVIFHGATLSRVFSRPPAAAFAAVPCEAKREVEAGNFHVSASGRSSWRWKVVELAKREWGLKARRTPSFLAGPLIEVLDCETLQARGSVVLGEAEVGNLARRVSAVWKLESRGAKRVADFGKRMFCGRGPVDILYDTLTYRRASPCCDVPLRAVL